MPDKQTVTTEPKMFWRDKDVEELTREELISALRQLYTMWQSSQEDHQSTLRMWELCRRAA